MPVKPCLSSYLKIFIFSIFWDETEFQRKLWSYRVEHCSIFGDKYTVVVTLTLNLSGWYSILTSHGIFIKNWILFNNSVCECGSAYYMGLEHGDMLVYFSVIKLVSNSKYLPKTTKYMKKLFSWIIFQLQYM